MILKLLLFKAYSSRRFIPQYKLKDRYEVHLSIHFITNISSQLTTVCLYACPVGVWSVSEGCKVLAKF